MGIYLSFNFSQFFNKRTDPREQRPIKIMITYQKECLMTSGGGNT